MDRKYMNRKLLRVGIVAIAAYILFGAWTLYWVDRLQSGRTESRITSGITRSCEIRFLLEDLIKRNEAALQSSEFSAARKRELRESTTIARDILTTGTVAPAGVRIPRCEQIFKERRQKASLMEIEPVEVEPVEPEPDPQVAPGMLPSTGGSPGPEPRPGQPPSAGPPVPDSPSQNPPVEPRPGKSPQTPGPPQTPESPKVPGPPQTPRPSLPVPMLPTPPTLPTPPGLLPPSSPIPSGPSPPGLLDGLGDAAKEVIEGLCGKGILPSLLCP